ncbi:GNAT family N-acetyltransferase [Pedobacter nyackensis]|uniref:GNAT family N-acetyltransferase n=1 Tax=Pedobacter nyackensis TaxID=475255 RepID=UPI0029306A9F|nr:GNAT family N-acetyltransferase [Pedobacter nyackensis]
MLKLDFSAVPHLTTERLLLRSIDAQDLKAIHQLRSDEAVNIMVGRETPTALSQSREFITKIGDLVENRECLYWVLAFKEENSLIGTISCWNFDIENEIVEIGYEMLPEFRGKGLMKEALKKVIEYTFQRLNAKLITAFPSGVNANSVGLLKALNFQFSNNPYNNKHTNVADIVSYILKK